MRTIIVRTHARSRKREICELPSTNEAFIMSHKNSAICQQEGQRAKYARVKKKKLSQSTSLITPFLIRFSKKFVFFDSLAASGTGVRNIDIKSSSRTRATMSTHVGSVHLRLIGTTRGSERKKKKEGQKGKGVFGVSDSMDA